MILQLTTNVSNARLFRLAPTYQIHLKRHLRHNGFSKEKVAQVFLNADATRENHSPEDGKGGKEGTEGDKSETGGKDAKRIDEAAGKGDEAEVKYKNNGNSR